MKSYVMMAFGKAQELLELELEQANKTIDELLSGVAGGFEELTRIMDLTSTGQDEYLTKTNQGYELNKMQRTLSKDIDKTDSKSAKAKLANFSKELRALQEKDKLSNLELEIASGGARDALSLLDQLIAFSGNHISLKNIEKVFGLTNIEEKINLLKLIKEKKTTEIIKELNSFNLRNIDISRLTSELLTSLKDSLVYIKTRNKSGTLIMPHV